MRRGENPSKEARERRRATRRVAALKGRRFALPPGTGDDPQPHPRVEHGCDYLVSPGGGLEFHYDVIDYHWRIGGEELWARRYLRDRDPPTVRLMLPFARFDPVAHAPVLAYLQRRFVVIETFEESGEVPERWVLG